MDSVSESLLAAQNKAVALFQEVLDSGMIRAGRLESELTRDIHALARARFGLSRHWHQRIVRSGPNTLLTYHDPHLDRQMTDDDIVYLDFGPVFDAWEADFGRTYALGSDPVKHRLIANLAEAFARGKALYRNSPSITAGEMYDYVAATAGEYGWEFGAATAGHLVGHFPHERPPDKSTRFSIRSGNPTSLREVDANGETRHWILEIHFVDRNRQIGGFFEELLTVEG
jgi:Xaa-Pro aminopeptidase